MPLSRAEADVEEQLTDSLATNEGRVMLFRQLVAYEQADTFLEWCQRWGADPRDPGAIDHWSNVHALYLAAWQRLGSYQFWLYMRLGAKGLRAAGGRT